MVNLHEERRDHEAVGIGRLDSGAVKGSHHQFKHPTKPGKVTVPHPKKDLPMPTVRSIMKQAGWK